jgi:c(7)-type cytochrome triheme protein
MNSKTVIAIAFGFATFCLAVATPYLDEQPAAFLHSVHIEEGAECGECHKHKEGSHLPQLNMEYCQECHDDEVPSYQLDKKASRLAIAFPHETHAESLECGDCHAGMAKDQTRNGKPMVNFDGCGKCHAEADIEVSAANCNACHGKNMRQHKPLDHKGAWLAIHGQESTWRVFDDHGQDCQTCHGPDTCRTCHTETRPRSHTALWRLRGHGLAAGWDRESCQTCHETGTCVRCHRETEPLSHKGPWETTHGLIAGDQENCAVCHSPMRLSTCGSCHK